MCKCVLLSNSNISDDYAFDKLKQIIKPNMKVLYFTYASELKWQLENQDSLIYGDKRKELFRHWKNFGIEYGNFIVAPFPKNKTEIRYIKEKIEKSDIIYFDGGFMENIKFVLELGGLWDYILKYKEDKIFMGSSAGALILQDKYHVTPHVDEYYDYFGVNEGLGVVQGYYVMPHFHNDNWYHKLNLVYCKVTTLRKKHFALGENGGVIIEGDNFKPFGDVFI